MAQQVDPTRNPGPELDYDPLWTRSYFWESQYFTGCVEQHPDMPLCSTLTVGDNVECMDSSNSIEMAVPDSQGQ